MADLGLVQAWQMWFDNVQVNQHTLHGWSILALGRAGKLVTFAAGLTIILDIAGQQRLTAVATWLRRERDRADLLLFGLLMTAWWFALAALTPDWRPPNAAVGILTNMAIGAPLSVASRPGGHGWARAC
ncbi:hypothetical protein [Nonomuraea sp. NPDC001831]|uniref:hypothetical protein n=1 Tax=Nonomuraea sp. NPDC001831 TaxID=3364340 RepID=UPI00368DD37E